MDVVIVVVVVVVLAAAHITWLAGRLDRLHARTDAAWASLDAQLVRRAAAAEGFAASPNAPLAVAARAARAAGPGEREAAENDLSRALHTALAAGGSAGRHRAATEDLLTACTRVVLARRFYNDAVRDTRVLRGQRLARWFHLAGHAPQPAYFEIDDTPPIVSQRVAISTPR